MLEVKGLEAGYGDKKIVRDLNLTIAAGECVGIIGPNGAGKSTTLLAIFGLIRPSAGTVRWEDRALTTATPAEHVAAGISLVLQGGRVFSSLTVEENLAIGGYTLRNPKLTRVRADEAYALYPRLAERRRQRAGLMSGGERQMLALAMTLMVHPRLLILDEPLVGLAPLVVNDFLETIRLINRDLGTSMLIVDQNARAILKVVTRALVIQVGQVKRTLSPADLQSDEALRNALLIKV